MSARRHSKNLPEEKSFGTRKILVREKFRAKASSSVRTGRSEETAPGNLLGRFIREWPVAFLWPEHRGTFRRVGKVRGRLRDRLGQGGWSCAMQLVLGTMVML